MVFQSTLSSSTTVTSDPFVIVYQRPTTTAVNWNESWGIECPAFGNTIEIDPLVLEFVEAMRRHEEWVKTRRLRSLMGAPPPRPLKSLCSVGCRPPRTRGKVSFRPSVLSRAARNPDERLSKVRGQGRAHQKARSHHAVPGR